MKPMTRALVTTPTRIAICCCRGVDPDEEAGLQVLEVVPPLDAAMHTMRRGGQRHRAVVDADPADGQEEQAGEEERGHRHPRDGVRRELPISPVMRDDTVTKKKPKSMMRSAETRLMLQETGRARWPTTRARRSRRATTLHRAGPARCGGRSVAALSPAEMRTFPRPVWKARDDGGHRADEADEAARRHRARADVEHVGAADLVRAHVADERRGREERRRRAASPKNAISGMRTR